MVLTSQPAGNVTVTISGHSGTDLTLSGTTLTNNVLTFTTDNWDTAQTVKVVAAEDDDADQDAEVTLVHAIGSTADTVYDALADQSVTVSITENDEVGVNINPTTLTVTEGDATGNSYTVVLATQPAGNVTVTISGHSGTDLTVSGTTLTNNVLTFTTDNWDTVQTVKVVAGEDADATTDPDVTLAHDISSTDDSDYNDLGDQSVTVSITEDDAAGVTINPTSLTVTEGDATGASYTVVLTSQPAGDVTIAISGQAGTDLTLSGTTLTNNVLTFTTENWGTAQTVTAKAAEDGDVTLVHDISSTDDSDYNALADQSVTVSITENDVVGVTINPTTLTVNEGDATGASYAVTLTSQPAGDVTIAISGQAGTDLTLSGTSLSNDGELTFTTENWGTAQTVKVKAAEDGDADQDADVTLVHAIGSTDDSAYNALADQSVTVSITENDVVGVTINPTTLTVNEGDATGNSYAVTLTSQPAGDVTIAISGQAGTDLTLSGTTLTNNVLTFTDQNWGTAQTVKVVAGEDDDADQDADVTLVHEISSTDDTAYHALADQSVTVSITENDAVGVTVTFEKEVHYTIEGASGAAGVEVLLSAPLQTEVTIPITVLSQSTADPDDYLVDEHAGYASDPGLTFSPGETFGYIFIKAVLDTVDENTETVVLGFGALPAGISEGSPRRSTVEIKDAIQVSFANSSYTVEEGGGGVEVVVKLNKPRNNLRIPLTANGHGGADASDFTGVPQEVVFKDDETEKTFTVVAIEDTEEENGEMVRLGFGAFSEGIVAISPDSAMVMINDDPESSPQLSCDAVWCATAVLTVRGVQDESRLISGWARSGSPPGSLSDDDFTYGGVEYTLGEIIVISQDDNPERSRFYFFFYNAEVPTEAHYSRWTLYIDDFTLSFTSDNMTPNGFVWRDLEFSTDKYRNPPITLQLRIEESSENQQISENGMAQAQGANTPATGAPVINGTPLARQELTADTSGIEDADGLTNVTYSYQWIAGGSDIDGAANSTYTLSDDDEGKAIRVRVSFTDDAGNDETLTSNAVAAAVAPLPPLTASLPNSPFQSPRHQGAGDKPQVVVAFSLPVASFEKTTPSVSLTGATVSSVRRHEEEGLENAWIFFLNPNGADDIVFSLVTGQPCDSGGICTEDGGLLSEGVQVTVPGPEEEEDEPEPSSQEQEQEQAGDDQQTPQSPPPAPTNLTATVNADGHIVLSWTAPGDDSITGYQVLRRRPGEGEATLLVYVADTRSTATTFTDTGVAAGVKHVYRVKAINAAGLSGWSNYVNPTP